MTDQTRSPWCVAITQPLDEESRYSSPGLPRRGCSETRLKLSLEIGAFDFDLTISFDDFGVDACHRSRLSNAQVAAKPNSTSNAIEI